MDWNARYMDGDTPWDKGGAAPPLDAFLEEHKIRGTVLVPGCGTGHDVRLLASHGAEPHGMDIAPEALKQARAFPRTGRELYHLGSILDLPDGFKAAFDWVFEHTCFCALPPDARPAYVDGVHAALKPKGRFLAIFYTDPEAPAPGEPPYPISDAELDATFGSHFETIRKWQPTRAFAHRAGREQMRLMKPIWNT